MPDRAEAPKSAVDLLPQALREFRYRGVSKLRLNMMYDYLSEDGSIKRMTLILPGIRMDTEGVIHVNVKYEPNFNALMKTLAPTQEGAKPGSVRFIFIEPDRNNDTTLVAKYPLDKAPVTFRLDISRKDFSVFTYTKPAVVPVAEEQRDHPAKRAGKAVRGATVTLFDAGLRTARGIGSAGKGFVEGLLVGDKNSQPKPPERKIKPAVRSAVSAVDIVAAKTTTPKAIAPLELLPEDGVKRIVEPLALEIETEETVTGVNLSAGEDNHNEFEPGSGV